MPSKKVFRRIVGYMRPHLWLMLFALLLTMGQVAATLAVPAFIGRALDALAGEGGVETAKLLASIGVLGALTAAVFVCQWLSSIFQNRISFYTVRDVRIDAFKKLNRVPIAYIDSHQNGDIMSRISNDAEQVSDGLIQGFTQLFTGVVTAAGTIVFMLMLNVPIAVVVIIITPLSLTVAWGLAKITYTLHRKRAEKLGELCGLCEEYLGNQKVVKAFNYEAEAEKRFNVLNLGLKKFWLKSMFVSSLTNPVTRLLNAIVYAVVAVMGALAVIEANAAVAAGTAAAAAFTIGSLSAMLAYAHQYAKPFNEITGVVTELQSAFAAARRVFSVIDAEEESGEAGMAELKDVKGAVSAQGVAFSYSPEKPLIKNFNIAVFPGQKIAIVGPTGCGKTTLINLLMRFYDVQKGVIAVDETDIKAVTRGSLRRNYGMVLQETWLFEGTVHDNIAYGKSDATRDEVIAAARQARCNGFIKRLPEGYDTMITSDGANLSHGQKQLICIARIMLTLPAMLILDEATSSIDTRTEKRVQTAFSRIMQGRTSFIIAHRLSTIQDADAILVMNDGDIIETGTHTELLAAGGFYANLYHSQNLYT
ncbi:MAG: ABC transporter ATP-binding protein/permease [Firmicutes bacterium]|nr:ABC transporter ATP-binding protein/permease [Bacillota bacterium]